MIPITPCPAIVPTPWHLSVGVCIGILGFLGIVMPLTRDKIGRREKIIWIAVFTSFLILEIWSIHQEDIRNRREQDHAGCEQANRFQEVGNTLTNSIEIGKAQYGTTLSHVNGVLKKTKEVAGLSKQNLENVTGGNSFAYIYPKPIQGKNLYGPDQIVWDIRNDGDDILTGVTVKLNYVTAEGKDSDALQPLEPYIIQAENLGSHFSEALPYSVNNPMTVTLNAQGIGHYIAFIAAQNGSVAENVFFRRAKAGNGYAYRLYVKQGVKGKRAKDDVRNQDGGWVRKVKDTAWIEPQ